MMHRQPAACQARVGKTTTGFHIADTRFASISSSAAGLFILFEQQNPVLIGGILLTLRYTVGYLGFWGTPGNNTKFPLGWWGWFDQSKYLELARALSRLDLSPAHHWYPLGYALLGAPFIGMLRQHPFFFVDLASLLIAYTAFVHFAHRCGVARFWSVTLFILACAGDPVLLVQWVVPWNTSPLAAVLWLLLATAAAHVQGERRPASLGVLAACVPMLRPTDTLIAAVPIVGSLAADLLQRRLKTVDIAAFAVAALLPLAAYAALYLAVYGLRLSEYILNSREIGFTLHNFDLKVYLILVDPRGWVGGGEGLIRRCLWLILGFAGLLTALRRPVPAMLALTLAVHGILYLSYVDLLPTGLWRYFLVHYWTFAFPGFALLGFLWVRDLLQPETRAVAVGALALVLLLLCIRLDPVPAGLDLPADALDLRLGSPAPDIRPGFRVTDADGTLTGHQIRAFPIGNTVRLIAIRRVLLGPVAIGGDGLGGIAPQRLRIGVGVHIPFWPWERAAKLYGPPG